LRDRDNDVAAVHGRVFQLFRRNQRCQLRLIQDFGRDVRVDMNFGRVLAINRFNQALLQHLS
jgi:hypothetical protein